MAVTVASRAMAATVAMEATTIPLHTMVDMVAVMITVCLYLPDTHDRSGVPFHVHPVKLVVFPFRPGKRELRKDTETRRPPE